ncbi:hypothetical protein V8E54_011689 [Elaphomyces granulatus]
MPCQGRWNSTHDVIKRAKRLKQGLDYFIDKETLEARARIGGSDAGYVVENRLSKEDWEILEEYEEVINSELADRVRKWNHHLQWLYPLAVATKSSRATQGLAANVLLAFEYILNHIGKTNEKYQGRGAKDRHLSAVVQLAAQNTIENSMTLLSILPE